jgi:hypothetical protein
MDQAFSPCNVENWMVVITYILVILKFKKVYSLCRRYKFQDFYILTVRL